MPGPEMELVGEKEIREVLKVLSFNVFKAVTSGEGGMIITDDKDLYRRCFAFHDQGHTPLRDGVEIGKRPFLGLDFSYTELQAAVLLAQVRRVPSMLDHMRANKQHWKGTLPQTDDLLARAMKISIGVPDAGLGSSFGMTVNDGPDIVDKKAAEFRQVAGRYLA
jgi:dTDP-4-amino-4,6-dideoxygalactose transaminase